MEPSGHEIRVQQPMIEQQFMAYRDGELEIERIGDSWPHDCDQDPEYECACGAEFESREEARQHIEEVANYEHTRNSLKLVLEREAPEQKERILDCLDDEVGEAERQRREVRQ